MSCIRYVVVLVFSIISTMEKEVKFINSLHGQSPIPVLCVLPKELRHMRCRLDIQEGHEESKHLKIHVRKAKSHCGGMRCPKANGDVNKGKQMSMFINSSEKCHLESFLQLPARQVGVCSFCNFFFHFNFLFIFILFDETDGESPSIHGFTAQIPATTRAGQDPRTHPRSPMWVLGTQLLEPSFAASPGFTPAESWMGNRVAWTQTKHSDMGCGLPKGQPNHCTKCPPHNHFLTLLLQALSNYRGKNERIQAMQFAAEMKKIGVIREHVVLIRIKYKGRTGSELLKISGYLSC